MEKKRLPNEVFFSGEARYLWRHAIPFRKYDCVDGELLKRKGNTLPLTFCLSSTIKIEPNSAGKRVSFTFRKVRGRPCTCEWPQECDSQQLSISHILQSSTGMYYLSNAVGLLTRAITLSMDDLQQARLNKEMLWTFITRLHLAGMRQGSSRGPNSKLFFLPCPWS